MDNQSTGKFSRITNNFDDIDIKKINYIDSSLQSKKENEKDVVDESPKKSISNHKNLNSQKMFSIIDKTSDLFSIKSDNNKQVEERKNIDMEKTNTNKYGLKLSDKLNHKKIDKSNIKDILSQNKKILSDITNIINNDNKNKRELNYANVYYQNSFRTSQNNNLTSKENKNEENNSNIMNVTNISKNENNNIRKTYFNYNKEYQKKMGGEDNYLENIEKYNKETNDKNIEIKYNNTDKFDNNINGEKIISSSGLVFGKKDLKNVKTMDILKSKNDLDKKLDEKLPNSNSSFNNYNKLINKKEYNFNYRNDDSFNIINKTDTQPILNIYKTEIEPKLNNFLDNKKTKIEAIKFNPSNEYYLKPDNDNNNNINTLKYNNSITNNDFKMENNDLLFNNSYNSSMNSYNFEEKERQIKFQIENEEKKLKQLEEEKNKLIKEEKERRQIIYNELSKREKSYKENNIDTINLLEKNKRIEYQMNSIDSNNLETSKKYENLNTSQNENYYKDYLKEISNRNELINKKTLEVINNNINKEKTNVNTNVTNIDNKVNIYEKINTNLTTNLNNSKKKSLSVNNRQLEIKDYIHNYSNGSNNKNFNITTNNLYDKTLKTINNINTYKTNLLRYDSERKYNVNSYFQLKEKENTYTSQPKPYYNNYTDEQSLSSYIDETNKENNINAHNKYYQGSLTPKGLFRNNKTDNNIVNMPNFREAPVDNLLYNNNYYNSNNNEIIKTLSTNNYSTMTQTRFYRNRAFPDNNYDNDNYKLKTLNTVKDYKSEFDLINNNANNFKKQNSTRSLFHLNFDLDKDFIDNSIKYNYIPNSSSQSSSRLINDNTFKFNTLASSNNIRNNNLYKSNKYTKSNSYRCKCSLRKGRSYNDFTKLIEPNDNSISINNNVNSLLKNLGNNNTGHDIATNLIKRNNYNNIVYKAFNQNNNSVNYQNGNYRNICQKCSEKHYFNENNGNYANIGNIGNGFRNYNNVKLCATCRKLFNDLNRNKRNNRFLFG